MNHPTLAAQQAAGLDLGDDGIDMSEAIYAAIQAGGPALKVDRLAEEKRTRALPVGVYRHHGALVASFSRAVGDRQRTIHVSSGPPGDFSAETAARLARAWDAERRSHD